MKRMQQPEQVMRLERLALSGLHSQLSSYSYQGSGPSRGGPPS